MTISRRRTLLLAMCLALAMAGTASAQWTPSTFGAVTDLRQTQDGLAVLAITPGSNAERIGLQVGDRIQSINGRSFVDSRQPASLLGQTLAESGGELRIEVVRNGARQSLAGRVAAPATSATGAGSGCGFLTTQGTLPRVTQGVYSSQITRIDGRSTPLGTVNRHRVDAGTRVLIVAEGIEELTIAQRRLRALMKRREQARAYKALMVDVAPNTTYFVGARLLTDRLDPDSIRANAYWEPVVWQERSDTPCP
jgi:membrane-associated protease RseP (regulator of RpoE activity)